MESIFHSLDCRSNPAGTFWHRVSSDTQEEIFSYAICSGNLELLSQAKGLQSKKFILTKSNLYCLSRFGIPKYKSNISWKLLEPFEEIHDGVSRFGFRLNGCHFQDFYANNSIELHKWLRKLAQVCILNTFEEDFIVIKELNKGASAVVKLCQSSESFQEFAVKTVNKNLFVQKPVTFENTINEISVLRNIDHPNIVKLFRVYEAEEEVHLVLEYLAGGDAQKRISKVKRVDEKTALKFIHQVLATLEFLHSHQIVHRDIKLENIAFCNDGFENFKIIDFGLAYRSTQRMNEKCGTVGFIAPEILRGALYNHKVDVFSAGVILYIFLTGKSLFTGKTFNEVLMKNKECQDFSCSSVKSIKQSTKKLLTAMLRPDPFLRLSSSDALTHQSFKEVLGAEYMYIANNDTHENSFFEKGNTTDTVNISQVRSKPKNNNYVRPL